MAWLRSEQSLQHHPKTKLLQSYLNITLPETIGRLHMLWYWCLDYALDGDLSRKEPKMIEQACDIPLKLLIKVGFVDTRPYRRIHDWYDNQSSYLKARFKDKPDKLASIQSLYKSLHTPVLHRGKGSSNGTRNPINKQTVSELVSETNKRTNKEKDAREAAALGASPRALPALTKVEAEDLPEFGHKEFLEIGWRRSKEPTQDFEWVHLEHTMSQHERVQSKWREKQYAARKWN